MNQVFQTIKAFILNIQKICDICKKLISAKESINYICSDCFKKYKEKNTNLPEFENLWKQIVKEESLDNPPIDATWRDMKRSGALHMYNILKKFF